YLSAQLNLSERARELVQRFELGEGVIGRAAVLGETIAVTDVASDRRVARRELVNERVGALVATPLVGRGGVRGVLTLFCHAARR
ncbi:GAF domain-containing protein, partial [Escherichia coli]|nr:GAF domain-containing protein [Escherichia coli]